MTPTEPKPQTPLTDAAEQSWREQSGQEGFVTEDFARSLELKLQEAKRQRDEAIKKLHEPDIEKYIKMSLERDQLITVVDKLSSTIEQYLNLCGSGYLGSEYFELKKMVQSQYDASGHSLLPHVLAKENKQ